MLVTIARRTVTAVEKVNVANSINVPHLAVQIVTQIWTVIPTYIAVNPRISWDAKSAGVVASERNAKKIQTVPCTNIVPPVKHVGLSGFIVNSAEIVRAVENAVALANVFMLTAVRWNTAVRVITVQTAVVQVVLERVVSLMMTVEDMTSTVII